MPGRVTPRLVSGGEGRVEVDWIIEKAFLSIYTYNI